MGNTGSMMSVYNDYPEPVTFTATNNDDMEDTWDNSSTTNMASGSLVSGYVQTSSSPGQSSYQVNYASGATQSIDLGNEPTYTSGASPNTIADGTGGSIIASGGSGKISWSFWFFNGPGVLQNLVNSFIQANLPAIVAYVANNPLTLDGSSVTGTFDFGGTVPSCTYAAIVPQADGSGLLGLNLHISVPTGNFNGEVTIGPASGSLDLTLDGALLFVRLIIDPTFAQKPTVEQFQLQLADYSVSGSLLGALEAEFSFLAPFIALLLSIASTNVVALKINQSQSYNTNILDGLNNVLSGFNIPAQPAPTYIPTPGPEPTLADHSTWMSTPQIQAKTLGQLKLPGTHDSATYQLDSVLSQVEYANIAFLWDLEPFAAPVDGTFPIPTTVAPGNKFYVGQVLYDWIMGQVVNAISRTQAVNITQQLQYGIRHFDFRVYYDSNAQDFYCQHALRGPKFSDILAQIQSFMNANPTSGELIFAQVSHFNFTDDATMANFATLVSNNINAANIYYPSTASGQAFNFQTLATKTVGSITNGSPKVMFLNGDDILFQNTIVNSQGYADVAFTTEMTDVPSLAAQQGPELISHSTTEYPLWAIDWVLGATNGAIIGAALSLMMTPGGSLFALQSIAAYANSLFMTFLTQHGGQNTNFNLVNMDWATSVLEGGQTLPEIIIAMNN